MTAGNLGWILGAAAVVALAATTPAAAGPSLAAADTARPPPAFAEFCAGNPAACRPSGANVSAIRLTLARRAELAVVNGTINRTTREVTDLELYGREDVWAYPVDGMGDCEDFALAKRRDLIRLGWPSSVLLMTVVRDQRGEGHAVLTVVTDRGDYILDNRTNSIRLWSQTPYTYYDRQSARDPGRWVRLAPAEAVAAAKGGKGPAASAAGAKGNGGGAASGAGGNGNAGGSNAAGHGNSNAGGNGGAASAAAGANGNGGGAASGGGGSGNAGGSNAGGHGNSDAGSNGSDASDGKAGGAGAGQSR